MSATLKTTARNPAPPTVALTMRWPTDIKAEMQLAAAVHRRSFSSEVFMACEGWIAVMAAQTRDPRFEIGNVDTAPTAPGDFESSGTFSAEV